MGRITGDWDKYWDVHENQAGNIVILTEPYLLHPENYIRMAASEAEAVFTNHKRFAERYANWHYYPLGGTFISEKEREIYEKETKISTFISHKDTMPGHLLRRKIYPHIKDVVDVFGNYTNNRIEEKIDGLREYGFSIVIESCCEPGYFTEKIIDCFLTGTIPIYWGDPNIDEYFAEDGIIKWNGDILTLITILFEIKRNYFGIRTKKADKIERNFYLALQYVNYKNTLRNMYPKVFNDKNFH